MAASASAEKTDASGAAPAAASARRLMSPMGYIVVVVIMGITAGVVFFVTRSFHDTGQKPVIQEAYEETELGQFSRELSPDPSNLVRDQFSVKIVLLLNPNYKNVAEVKPLVDKRKNLLKHIVSTEIIHPKTEAELRNPGILEALGNELRHRLNAEFGASKDGQEVIHKVIFPESRLPTHR